MFRLKKKRPPFGTAEIPLWEYAYSEQAKVVNGLCEVHHQATRDYLVKIGYEELELEEAVVAPSENGTAEGESAPFENEPEPKRKKWHRRK